MSSAKKIDHPSFGEITITQRRGTRHFRMRSTGYRKLSISAPPRASQKAILSFIENHKSWIEGQKTWRDQLFKEGTQLTNTHKLSILDADIDAPQHNWNENTLDLFLPAELDVSDCRVQLYVYRAVTKKLREDAKKTLIVRAKELAAIHGVKLGDIRIKNSVTRWGSYSSQGNLNLNLQLLRLGHDLQDHVIIHELAHAKHLSHSREFWNHFASMRPNMKAENRQLKAEQLWRKPC